MNTCHDRRSASRLPAEVHNAPLSPAAAAVRPRGTPPPAGSPSDVGATPRRRPGIRTGVICLVMAAGLCAAVIPAWRSVGGSAWGDSAAPNVGEALGNGLLQGGLPPTHAFTTAEDTPPVTESEAWSEPPESLAEPWDTHSEETPDGVDTDPLREPETDTGTATAPAEDETHWDPGVGAPDSGAPDSGTETDGREESATDEPADGRDPLGEPETGGDPGEDTAPPISVPAGCYPFAAKDMSMTEYGVGYVEGDAALLPDKLPAGRLWSTQGAPAVLVVHTHPYEGYSDGSAWYDPAAGGLALTESPNASDGVVALGAELIRALRESGVTVIHVRVAVSAEDSAADIYDRTETVARYYCRLYPDIGLVMNLRRSAELTEEGAVLRTAGSYGGETCAQLRISVHSGRSEAELGADLAAALLLRAGLWDADPTVSRPVCVKEGKGFVADLEGVRVLTLEMGSAGNTYAEAEALVLPLSEALAGMLSE